MKKLNLLYCLIILLLISNISISQEQSSFQYVSPKPNSTLVSKETNIIFLSADLIDQSSLADKNIISGGFMKLKLT